MSRPDDTHPDAGPWPSPFESFTAGELIGRRYRVLRPLGRGAMGEVYAVRDEPLGSDVALKLLRPAAHADADARERFKREILLARRVSHPNVCRIFDFGTHEVEGPAGAALGPLHFLTMELLDGETLVARVERDGPLAESAALAIARQLAAALDAAHRVGVVHRDFKSSNIVLVGGDPPRAVVTDFGLAREAATDPEMRALTLTGGVLGTPAYMAPEQVEGARADARSDLYALGVVLYEMLTGRFPFEGDSPLAVALKRLQEPPVPAEVYRPDLSPRTLEVLRRTLARKPEGATPRPPSCCGRSTATLRPCCPGRRVATGAPGASPPSSSQLHWQAAGGRCALRCRRRRRRPAA
jgi:eukaryotic-like serine/threonine-protein kinase